MLDLTLLPVSLVPLQVGIFACPRVLPVPGFIVIVMGVHVVLQKTPEIVFPFPTWLSGSLRRLRSGREHCVENTQLPCARSPRHCFVECCFLHLAEEETEAPSEGCC